MGFRERSQFFLLNIGSLQFFNVSLTEHFRNPTSLNRLFACSVVSRPVAEGSVKLIIKKTKRIKDSTRLGFWGPTLTTIPLQDVVGRTLQQVLSSTAIKTFFEMATRSRNFCEPQKKLCTLAVFKLWSREASRKSL